MRAVPEYRSRLQQLEIQYGHKIAVLPDGEGQLERFNCFAYAFGIWAQPEYQRLVDKRQSSVLVNSAFTSELIARGQLMEVGEEEVESGNIVLYLASDKPRHAGIVDSAICIPIIRSKWGGNEVHRHALWELPASHGDCVRYFKQPDREAILIHLMAVYAGL